MVKDWLAPIDCLPVQIPLCTLLMHPLPKRLVMPPVIFDSFIQLFELVVDDHVVHYPRTSQFTNPGAVRVTANASSLIIYALTGPLMLTVARDTSTGSSGMVTLVPATSTWPRWTRCAVCWRMVSKFSCNFMCVPPLAEIDSASIHACNANALQRRREPFNVQCFPIPLNSELIVFSIWRIYNFNA